MSFLEFRGVSFRAGGRAILHDIDLAVEEGETLVLLGRSGHGKTTLLKLANRLREPSGGQISRQGRALAEWDPIELRRKTGYVIQDGGLFPHRTVAQNIGTVPSLQNEPKERIALRVNELLEAMNLPQGFGGRYPRGLSGGEKQRVGIARALAADAPLLLLDEPFSALDPITRHQLQKQFSALRATLRKTAMFVTHDLREALAIGSRIALIHNGRIDTLATPAEFLKASSEEARAFLATLDHAPN